MPSPRPENAAFHALARAGRVDFRLSNHDLASVFGISPGVVMQLRARIGARRTLWAHRSKVTPDRAAAIVGMRVAVRAAGGGAKAEH